MADQKPKFLSFDEWLANNPGVNYQRQAINLRQHAMTDKPKIMVRKQYKGEGAIGNFNGVDFVDDDTLTKNLQEDDSCVICGFWPSNVPDIIMRLCSGCGREVAIEPISAASRNFLCPDCAKPIIDYLIELAKQVKDDAL